MLMNIIIIINTIDIITVHTHSRWSNSMEKVDGGEWGCVVIKRELYRGHEIYVI